MRLPDARMPSRAELRAWSGLGVRPYRQSPEPAEDLLQAGYVGLLKAISNFDPGYGDSLAAYAQPCISGAMLSSRAWSRANAESCSISR
ncbi:MAG TPA: sigma factor [Streptosporangiaceae bacterium]|nr:sigma factor [Streptosporangiaceae bacterium]